MAKKIEPVKNYFAYFRSHSLNVFYPTRAVAKDLGDATILFDRPYRSENITFTEILNNSFIRIQGIQSEGKLVGYVITIPAYFSHRSIGASLFVASSVADIEVPSHLDSPFTGKNFSLFVDDKEQAVACIGTTPIIVDVTKG